MAANQPGNAQFAAAPTVTQTVTVVSAVQLNVFATPNLVFLNNPVTLTATISFIGPAPTGTVSFFDGKVLIGTAPLSNQTATFVVSTLSLGTHSITASYGGNTLYAAAASPPAAVTVEDFGLALLTNPNLTIFHGGTATFMLSVSETNPSGMASTVDLAVTGTPDGSQVTLTPASIAAGVATTPATLVIFGRKLSFRSVGQPARRSQRGNHAGGVAARGHALASVGLGYSQARETRRGRLAGGPVVRRSARTWRMWIGLENAGVDHPCDRNLGTALAQRDGSANVKVPGRRSSPARSSVREM